MKATIISLAYEYAMESVLARYDDEPESVEGDLRRYLGSR